MCGNLRCRSYGDFAQTLVQDLLSLTRSVTGKAERACSPTMTAARVFPQERPSWTVGVSVSLFPPSGPRYTAPLSAHRLALVPPWE